MNEWLVICGIASAALSGVPGLFFARTKRGGEKIATAFMLFSAGCGSVGAFGAIVSPGGAPLAKPWRVPGGEFVVSVDGISAMFLLQVFLIGVVGSVYGLGYWGQREHPENGRKLRLFYGLLTAAMALLIVARNSILFLVGWEVMALAAFLVVTTEDEKAEVRQAGYLYLVATRIGTLCLFGMFALLHAATGTFEFGTPQISTSPAVATAIFLLGLTGCGIKAGIMPLHVWLPGAHANAPSHVSSYMSGVLIKMGIYGLVRLCSSFAHPPLWWGILILGLGVLSGVFGVAFAIGQHDIKRLLAYHSVENIGIICLGLGLALIGRSVGRSDLVVLGLAGALLHVWNHGLFKALLFLGAGSVIHATHTREIDHLGGLMRKTPWTAIYFLIGAVAICGLPPLNGFVSELFVYLGLFRSMAEHQASWWIVTIFATPALALIGGLALACFVKVFGAVFLGQPRSHHVEHAHESGSSMVFPMALLAACCILIGVGPALVAPVLDSAVGAWTPGSAHPSLSELVPLRALTVSSAALLGAILLAWCFLQRRLASRRVATAVTWDCGYGAPSATMQYTSSSFAQILVGLFGYALQARVEEPVIRGPFPKQASFRSDVPDTVLDRFLLPVTRFIARAFSSLYWIQRGNVHLYLSYVFGTVVLLLLWR